MQHPSHNPETTMTWQTTYPTLATAMAANFATLQTWADSLPAPQTDVERTVRRRLLARRNELAAIELRTKHPEIADKLNDLGDRLFKACGARPFERM